jgi:SAM-dependent methyltransferase
LKDFNPNKRKGIFTSFLHQIMLVDLCRYIVAKIRFIYFVKFRRKLRIFETASDKISRNTVSHNMKGISDLAVARSLSLIRPLSIIESLNSDSDILSIGPRTEGEILNLIAHGFKPDKVKGLDLISYSPWIKLGDMHEIPYANDSFDAVILGWVIAYSEDRYKAASEVVRICRNGGIVAVGVEYRASSNEDIIKQLGYKPGSLSRINNTDEILKYFSENVDYVYFRHDALTEIKDKPVSLITIFSIKK